MISQRSTEFIRQKRLARLERRVFDRAWLFASVGSSTAKHHASENNGGSNG